MNYQNIINEKQTLELMAIKITPQEKQAVINRRVLSEGEEILGYRVKSIEHWKVILIRYGKEKVLQLNSSIDNFNFRKILN